MNKLLRCIFIMMMGMQILSASEFTIEMLRTQEKYLAISDFKKLYKKRQSFKTQLLQRVKHKRSKSLDRSSVFDTLKLMDNVEQIELLKPEPASDIYNNANMQTKSNNIMDMLNDSLAAEIPYIPHIDNENINTENEYNNMESIVPSDKDNMIDDIPTTQPNENNHDSTHGIEDGNTQTVEPNEPPSLDNSNEPASLDDPNEPQEDYEAIDETSNK